MASAYGSSHRLAYTAIIFPQLPVEQCLWHDTAEMTWDLCIPPSYSCLLATRWYFVLQAHTAAYDSEDCPIDFGSHQCPSPMPAGNRPEFRAPYNLATNGALKFVRRALRCVELPFQDDRLRNRYEVEVTITNGRWLHELTGERHAVDRPATSRLPLAG